MVSRDRVNPQKLTQPKIRPRTLEDLAEQEENWSDDTASDDSFSPLPTSKQYPTHATPRNKPRSTPRSSYGPKDGSHSVQNPTPSRYASRDSADTKHSIPYYSPHPAPNPGGQIYVSPSSQRRQVKQNPYEANTQSYDLPSQPNPWYPYYPTHHLHQPHTSQTSQTDQYQSHPSQAYEPHPYQSPPVGNYQHRTDHTLPPRSYEQQTYQYQPPQVFRQTSNPQWSARNTDPYLQRKVGQLEAEGKRSELEAKRERRDKEKAEARAIRLEREAQKLEDVRRMERSQLREMKKTMESLQQRMTELQLERLGSDRAQRIPAGYILRDLQSPSRVMGELSSESNLGHESLHDELIEFLNNRMRQKQRRLTMERDMYGSTSVMDSSGPQFPPTTGHDTLSSGLVRKMVQTALVDMLQYPDKAPLLGVHTEDLSRPFMKQIKRKPRDYKAEASRMHSEQKELGKSAQGWEDESELSQESSDSKGEESDYVVPLRKQHSQQNFPRPRNVFSIRAQRSTRNFKKFKRLPTDSGYGSFNGRTSSRSRTSKHSDLSMPRIEHPDGKNIRLPRQPLETPRIRKPKEYKTTRVLDAREPDSSSEGTESITMIPERKRAPYFKRYRKRVPVCEAPELPPYATDDDEPSRE